MVFQYSLSDSKFPRVSRTLLIILADLNNTVVTMVSTGPLISKSPVPPPIFWWLYRARQLQLVSLSPPCSIDFSVLCESLATYLSFRFPSFYPGASRNSKVHSTVDSRFFLLLLLTTTRFCRLAVIRWSICITKSWGSLFGLVSLFNGISTLFRLFNVKAILLEEQ